MAQSRLILASTSPYRSQLLAKLNVPFQQRAPEYAESTVADESPAQLAMRHATGKATAVLAVQDSRSPFLIIGCDQVAHLDNDILGKPGDHATAISQLTACSGQWVSFCTAIYLINEHEQCWQGCETYRIKYRELSHEQIEHYLRLDQPYDCAGSIKAEQAGIMLLTDSSGRDINTLFGLPLMLLVDLLGQANYSINTSQ